MEREYLKEWSPALGRDMELLRFGRAGRPLLVFPTSMGRFYQWEDFGMVGALADRIESGGIQLWCVDSVDAESLYASERVAAERISRHLQYERYLLQELMPRVARPPVAAGLSLGALHALLIALRHPERFSGFIAVSGAYDTGRFLGPGAAGEAHFLNPLAFLPGLRDETQLRPLRRMDPKAVVTGTEDPNVKESEAVAGLLHDIGVEVVLDLWPGWNHDWPYWKEMIRRYV